MNGDRDSHHNIMLIWISIFIRISISNIISSVLIIKNIRKSGISPTLVMASSNIEGIELPIVFVSIRGEEEEEEEEEEESVQLAI